MQTISPIAKAIRAELKQMNIHLAAPVPFVEKKHPTKPSLAKGVVTLPRGKEFLLIVEISKNDIYNKDNTLKGDLQIVPGTPPGKASRQEQAASNTWSAVEVDFTALLSRLSMKGMNITQSGAYLKLYMKFEEVGNHKGELGFDTWKNGSYASLAKKVMARTFKTATFKIGEERSSLTLKKATAEVPATTKVYFAIEQAQVVA